MSRIRLRSVAVAVISFSLLASCGGIGRAAPEATSPRAVPAEGERADLGGGVEVRHLAGRIWVHTSTKDGIPSNGLVVGTDQGPLLIDSAWDDEQTGRIAAWARERFGAPLRRAVATHSHDDRLGGIDTLRALGVRMGALDLTRKLAARRGDATLPDVLLTARQQALRDGWGFEVFHPGAGHAPDNVVVWFPEERVVFGGCLVKSAAARDLGFTGDADLASWPGAVAAVARRYPEARIVVPGHGAPGGTDLLDHTRALLAAGPRPGGG